MGDKMVINEEKTKRISKIHEEIYELESKKSKLENEINEIVLKSGLDFADSFIEYYTGEEYVFMRVERQSVTSNASGTKMNLEGPAIRLDANPLDELDDGVTYGEYNEYYSLVIPAAVMEEITLEHVRQITKKDMSFVLDSYVAAMKKNLL